MEARTTPVAVPSMTLVGVDGAIPVLEYHGLGPTDGRWVRSPQGLASDLASLYAEGFRPVDLDQIEMHPIPVPAGAHPVVLTFDDGLPSEFTWSASHPGQPSQDSSVGILWHFHLTHPDWAFRATFFVNRRPFGTDSGAKLRWLVAHGAEIGNHTYDHANLGTLAPAQRLAEVGRLQAYLAQALPGYTVQSFAYPYGGGATLAPDTFAWGTYQGVSWHFHYLAEVGASPLEAQPTASLVDVPRIQVAAPGTCAPSTVRWIWYGWQHDWLPHARLYTVEATGQSVTTAVYGAGLRAAGS